MKPAIERRNFNVTEFRTITDDKGLRKITGYAAVFNSISDECGWFKEKIEPGAFGESIGKDDIRALWNHDSNYVLGRNKSGSLMLVEDTHGLKIEIDPPDTQWARDLMVSMERGDISQMSFGFQTLTDRWELQEGKEIRTLEKVKLFDVSAVTFPAYPDTEVGLRSLEEYRKTAPPVGVKDGVEAQVHTDLLGEEDLIYRSMMNF